MLSVLTRSFQGSQPLSRAVAPAPRHLNRRCLLEFIRVAYQQSDGERESKRHAYRQLVYLARVTPPQAQQLLEHWDADTVELSFPVAQRT